MSTLTARYDGLADWYEEFNRDAAAANFPYLLDLLGTGTGRCLDLCCGTGLYLDMLRESGRDPIGLDFSGDQLRLARDRGPVVRGDAGRLPFPDNSFATVTANWMSTDVDDFGRVMREAARVLEPGGALVFMGVHPCFNGPCIENREDGARVIHDNYLEAGWHLDAPWWGYSIRRRVGMRHVPLGEFLTAFPAAGLVIERVVEPPRHPIPYALGVRATKPGS